jgi:outer membrane protein assembly factor BamB
MSRRTPVWAEDSSVRVLCLVAGIVLLLVPASARAQEAEGGEPGTEVAEDTAPPPAPEKPKTDPRAEARRRKEGAATAKRRRAAEAKRKELERRKKIAEDRKKTDEEKRKKALEARAAKIAADKKRYEEAVAKKEAARKAKLMARKRAVEAARRKKGLKGGGDIALDDKILAKLKKSRGELEREARIEAAQVSLPPDLRLQYLWSLPLERPVAKGDIWVHKDIILLLADRSVLYCIRKRDGVPMWAIELGDAPLYPPAVGKRIVYAFVRNMFIGIDRARGEVIWRINPGFAPSAAPCVSEPNLYIPAWDKRVYGVEILADRRVFYGGRTENALTTTEYRFRELWHKTAKGYVLGTPVLLDGFIYFGSQDGYLYAVSQDGEDRYNVQTQGPIRAPVTSRGANVYVGSSDFSVYAFDRLTGQKQWVYPTGSHVLAAVYPDVPSGVAMVASHKNGIFGINDRPTPDRGSEVWHIADAVSIAGVSQDSAYLILSDRRLAAVEKKKGTVQWVSLLEGVREVVSTMNDWTLPDEQFRLICLTESGHIACLKEPKEAVRRAVKARE